MATVDTQKHIEELAQREFTVLENVLDLEDCYAASKTIMRIITLGGYRAMSSGRQTGFSQVDISPSTTKARFMPGVMDLQRRVVDIVRDTDIVASNWAEDDEVNHRTTYGNVMDPYGSLLTHRDRNDLVHGTAVAVLEGTRSAQILSAKEAATRPEPQEMPDPVLVPAGSILFLSPDRPWHFISNPLHTPGVSMPITQELRR